MAVFESGQARKRPTKGPMAVFESDRASERPTAVPMYAFEMESGAKTYNGGSDVRF
ncbi:hypothetical protein ACFO4N_10720 [Camelliibacillus cellulosilyticus]|uniref:Uncharacterized protein n=1 Tax=Camelliibacillus cellulosilyticus TaxID=2174486 RepID=A0ABV9GQM4_9BACL